MQDLNRYGDEYCGPSTPNEFTSHHSIRRSRTQNGYRGRDLMLDSPNRYNRDSYDDRYDHYGHDDLYDRGYSDRRSTRDRRDSIRSNRGWRNSRSHREDKYSSDRYIDDRSKKYDRRKAKQPKHYRRESDECYSDEEDYGRRKVCFFFTNIIDEDRNLNIFPLFYYH